MKIFLVSLGCDKNRVDSEEMLGLISVAGFSFTEDVTEADVIIINTCCFINDAKEESIETILEMAQYKETGSLKKLIVTGCLAERYAEEIRQELPEVDELVGVSELPKILHAISDDFSADPEDSRIREIITSHKRVLTTPGHYEFLKIAEGCNKFCSYCVIPFVRGRYKSEPMEKLLDEAAFLADAGVKELIVVAQETNIYGTDLYGENRLCSLLKGLSDINGIKWIRLMYSYPEDIDDELIELMAGDEKLLNYFDMPIQHASDNILKAMGRKTSRADLINKIEKIRNVIPDVCLRTSLISGFPGETEEDHQILKDFVSDIKFDRLGVFTYSREEGTKAYNMKGQITKKIKEKRRSEIMKLQEKIMLSKAEDRLSKTFDIITDGYIPEDDIYVGRSFMDAPDVDGLVYFKSEDNLLTGDMVKVLVTGANQYDMYGEMEDII